MQDKHDEFSVKFVPLFELKTCTHNTKSLKYDLTNYLPKENSLYHINVLIIQ